MPDSSAATEIPYTPRSDAGGPTLLTCVFSVIVGHRVQNVLTWVDGKYVA